MDVTRTLSSISSMRYDYDNNYYICLRVLDIIIQEWWDTRCQDTVCLVTL